MRSAAVLLALILATPAAASGWKTVVQDANGIRSIALIGLVGETESAGVAFSCTGMAEGTAPVLFVTAEPWLDYSIAPGDAASVAVNAMEIDGKITANDSEITMGMAESFDLAEAVKALEAMPSYSVVLLKSGARTSGLAIPSTNRERALTQFREACNL